MTETADIANLEGRISAAMDRIARRIDKIGAPDPAQERELAELRGNLESERAARKEAGEALEKEKAARAEAEKQLAELRESRAAGEATLRERHDKQVAQMQVLDSALQQLKAANAKLRDNNARLREANREGVGDAGLINAGLQAELEALRAERAAERAEAEAVLTSLQPLVAADG